VSVFSGAFRACRTRPLLRALCGPSILIPDPGRTWLTDPDSKAARRPGLVSVAECMCIAECLCALRGQEHASLVSLSVRGFLIPPRVVTVA
jgi:hypothetical protein